MSIWNIQIPHKKHGDQSNGQHNEETHRHKNAHVSVFCGISNFQILMTQPMSDKIDQTITEVTFLLYLLNPECLKKIRYH